MATTEHKVQNDILSYREMCDAENAETMQRGMNFRMRPGYSVLLMSQHSNAPYADKIYEDGVTIEYEGHDVSRKSPSHDPKLEDQQDRNPSGSLTQNGLFAEAVNSFKEGKTKPELVKIYEKIFPGNWSLKGYFNLIDYRYIQSGKRKVYRFILTLSDNKENIENRPEFPKKHIRLIPSAVKREVWKRDEGKCVLCGESKNLHYDHDLPFSKGGTSDSADNVRILCAKHNLGKSNKIE